MPSPFTHGTEEIVYGFLRRPEVAEEVARIAWKNSTLFGGQFFDGRMSLSNVLFSG